MAKTIWDFEENKNAVIMYYNGYGPQHPNDKPYGCTIRFYNYSISASIWEKGFRVFKNSENLSKHFITLKEAKQFIIDRYNKQNKLL